MENVNRDRFMDLLCKDGFEDEAIESIMNRFDECCCDDDIQQFEHETKPVHYDLSQLHKGITGE